MFIELHIPVHLQHPTKLICASGASGKNDRGRFTVSFNMMINTESPYNCRTAFYVFPNKIKTILTALQQPNISTAAVEHLESLSTESLLSISAQRASCRRVQRASQQQHYSDAVCQLFLCSMKEGLEGNRFSAAGKVLRCTLQIRLGIRVVQ